MQTYNERLAASGVLGRKGAPDVKSTRQRRRAYEAAARKLPKGLPPADRAKALARLRDEYL